MSATAVRAPLWPSLLALFAAALYALSFPPSRAGLVTGWIALVPLLFAMGGGGAWRASLLGAAFGFTANALLFHWLLAVPGFRWYHFVLLGTYASLYPAAWCAFVSKLRPEQASWPFAVAASWAVLEFLKSHAGFLAIPWATLAQTQVDDSWLLPLAGVFGETSVSFVTALGNAAIYCAISGGAWRKALMAAIPIGCALAFGATTLAFDRPHSHARVRVAGLQTFYPAYGPGRRTADERARQVLDFLERELPRDAQLVVTPESTFVAPMLGDEVSRRLRDLASARQATLVAGAAQIAKFERPGGRAHTLERRVHNGAWLIAAHSPPQFHDKAELLPFVEYLPLRGRVPWPRWLASSPLLVARGHGPRVLASNGDVRAGLMICWESGLSSHARALAKRGANVLVVLANDGWFPRSRAGALHTLTARMRAAETRRPLVMATNEGTSAVIDRFGRALVSLSGERTMQWVVADVAPGRGLSVHTRIGDAFVVICVFVWVGAFRGSRIRAEPAVSHS